MLFSPKKNWATRSDKIFARLGDDPDRISEVCPIIRAALYGYKHVSHDSVHVFFLMESSLTFPVCKLITETPVVRQPTILYCCLTRPAQLYWGHGCS